MRGLEDFRKGFTGIRRKASDIVRSEPVWTAEFTTEYLRALAQGDRFLYPEAGYPRQISLPGAVHERLNSMRSETAHNGNERWALIGFKDDRRAIYLPTVNVQGGRTQVPGVVIAAQKALARQRHGIIGSVGSLHSHPEGFDTPKGFIAFSPADFYCAVDGNGDREMVMGITEGEMNMMVFASAETRHALLDPVVTQEVFNGFWEREFERRDPLLHALGVIGERYFEPEDITAMNKAIAQQYHLVLYRGRKDQPLERLPLT